VYASVRAATDRCRTDEECARFAEKAILDYLGRSNSESAVFAQKADQINSACSKIAGLVMRRIADAGTPIDRSVAGQLRKRINTQKKKELGSVDGADDETLDRHWAWLKQLERRILLDHGLNGVPQWLR
jgi:hypothetical protein